MEYIIFALVGLIALVIFVALPFALLKLAFVIGRATGVKGMRWALPLIILGVPLAWALGSHAQFKHDCMSVPRPIFLATPDLPQAGIFAGEGRGERRYYSPQYVLSLGVFEFVEAEGYQGSLVTRIRHAKDLAVGTMASSKTAYLVTDLPLRQVSYWWAAPIYVHEIQVRERAGGALIASATDLVFGGGLLSYVMRLIGGDQDYDFISCGYASPDIGPWRPSLATRVRVKQYEAADAAFLRTALTPRQRAK
jgi:hypothetical protein